MATYSATGITLVVHKYKGTQRIASFYTREKVEEVVKDLIQGGQLTREQGSKLLEELVKRGEEGKGEFGAKFSEDVRELFAKVSPVTHKELDAVCARLEAVEKHLGLDRSPPPDQDDAIG